MKKFLFVIIGMIIGLFIAFLFTAYPLIKIKFMDDKHFYQRTGYYSGIDEINTTEYNNNVSEIGNGDYRCYKGEHGSYDYVPSIFSEQWKLTPETKQIITKTCSKVNIFEELYERWFGE